MCFLVLLGWYKCVIHCILDGSTKQNKNKSYNGCMACGCRWVWKWHTHYDPNMDHKHKLYQLDQEAAESCGDKLDAEPAVTAKAAAPTCKDVGLLPVVAEGRV